MNKQKVLINTLSNSTQSSGDGIPESVGNVKLDEEFIKRCFTVNILYQEADDYHYFTSDELAGLYIGSSDFHAAHNSVCPTIEILMEANHKVRCSAQFLMPFDEFLEVPNEQRSF